MHLIYDNSEAHDFINDFLPQEIKHSVTEGDIDYVVAIICDYYLERGFVEDEIDDETIIELHEEDIISYVLQTTKNNNTTNLTSNEISFIIQGELAYCDSKGIFE